MIKLNLSLESLGRLKRAYPSAVITEAGKDEYCVKGIEEKILSSFGQIITESENPSPTAQTLQIPVASIEASDRVPTEPKEKPTNVADTTQADMVQAFNKFVNLIADKKTSSVMAAATTTEKKVEILQKSLQETHEKLERSVTEKTNEVNRKLENSLLNEKSERNLEINQSFKNFEALLNQYQEEIKGLIQDYKEKIEIMEKAWQDERNNLTMQLKAREADDKKISENLAKIVKYFRELPLPQ